MKKWMVNIKIYLDSHIEEDLIEADDEVDAYEKAREFEKMILGECEVRGVDIKVTRPELT